MTAQQTQRAQHTLLTDSLKHSKNDEILKKSSVFRLLFLIFITTQNSLLSLLSLLSYQHISQNINSIDTQHIYFFYILSMLSVYSLLNRLNRLNRLATDTFKEREHERKGGSTNANRTGRILSG